MRCFVSERTVISVRAEALRAGGNLLPGRGKGSVAGHESADAKPGSLLPLETRPDSPGECGMHTNNK